MLRKNSAVIIRRICERMVIIFGIILTSALGHIFIKSIVKTNQQYSWY